MSCRCFRRSPCWPPPRLPSASGSTPRPGRGARPAGERDVGAVSLGLAVLLIGLPLRFGDRIVMAGVVGAVLLLALTGGVAVRIVAGAPATTALFAGAVARFCGAGGTRVAARARSAVAQPRGGRPGGAHIRPPRARRSWRSATASRALSSCWARTECAADDAAQRAAEALAAAVKRWSAAARIRRFAGAWRARSGCAARSAASRARLFERPADGADALRCAPSWMTELTWGPAASLGWASGLAIPSW